ncbi:hypothetical protein QZH41_006565 [Actinostola sp. cb2023]|nr:hypothetical protein QZH41_006565 [Actinostola sp. cb2023]
MAAGGPLFDWCFLGNLIQPAFEHSNSHDLELLKLASWKQQRNLARKSCISKTLLTYYTEHNPCCPPQTFAFDKIASNRQEVMEAFPSEGQASDFRDLDLSKDAVPGMRIYVRGVRIQVRVKLFQMAFILDNLSADWKAVDASSDASSQGYKEYLICHRLPTNNNKTDFKYSASEGDDSKPVELLLHGANKRDPLHGVQRPMLKVIDDIIVGVDVCGERCERNE